MCWLIFCGHRYRGVQSREYRSTKINRYTVTNRFMSSCKHTQAHTYRLPTRTNGHRRTAWLLPERPSIRCFRFYCSSNRSSSSSCCSNYGNNSSSCTRARAAVLLTAGSLPLSPLPTALLHTVFTSRRTALTSTRNGQK